VPLQFSGERVKFITQLTQTSKLKTKNTLVVMYSGSSL